MRKDPKKTKSALSLVAVLLVTLAAFGFILSSRDIYETVKFTNVSVPVEIVNTPEDLAKGLSGRSSIAAGHGMLFVYDEPTKPGIWMKDMHFNIDVLWLDEEGRVVSIVEDMAPSTYPAVYTPQLPSRYVLELPSGFVRLHSIVVGARATLPLL